MKNYLLFTLLTLSTISFSQTIEFYDDFDSYNANMRLVEQATSNWNTWSGGGGTSEDPIVVDTLSNSPNNSVNIFNLGPSNWLHDLVLEYPSNYTTGVIELRLKVFITAGSGGYINMGDNWSVGGTNYTPGIAVYFTADGTGYINTPNMGPFSYAQEEWVALRISVDLDNDVFVVNIDGNDILSYYYETDNANASDIFPIAPSDGSVNSGEVTANFFIDDVELISAPGFQTLGVTPDLNKNDIVIYPNPISNGEFRLKGIESGSKIEIINEIGEIVFTDILNSNSIISVDLKSGLYYLKCISKGETITKGITIIH